MCTLVFVGYSAIFEKKNEFVLRLNISMNNVSVIPRRNQRFLGIQYCEELAFLAQGHNMVPSVGIESSISRFKVRCSASRPPRSLTSFAVLTKNSRLTRKELNLDKYIQLRFISLVHTDLFHK